MQRHIKNISFINLFVKLNFCDSMILVEEYIYHLYNLKEVIEKI